jgi:hypothetical protein
MFKGTKKLTLLLLRDFFDIMIFGVLLAGLLMLDEVFFILSFFVDDVLNGLYCSFRLDFHRFMNPTLQRLFLDKGVIGDLLRCLNNSLKELD